MFTSIYACHKIYNTVISIFNTTTQGCGDPFLDFVEQNLLIIGIIGITFAIIEVSVCMRLPTALFIM